MNKRQGAKKGREGRKGIWSSWKEEILHVLVYAAIILVMTFLVINYVGQRTQVNGESMYPTLYHKDNLIVDKFSYHFQEPERYDIVVFPYQYKENTYYIKRVIGLPGETVQIIDGYVYIDGEKLDENYGKEVIEEAALAAEPVILGEDEYFVLGDNRNASEDSRFPDVGNIKREDIIGKAWVRIWPLTRVGFLKHQ